MTIRFSDLEKFVSEQAAFRRRQRLQPVGGVGSLISPPTYPGEGRNAEAQHAFERRRVNNETVWTGILDSVQSSANRAEEALGEATQDGDIELPQLVVDFAGTGAAEIGSISSLAAPHRVYDAILRDSELDGKPLMKSPVGIRLQTATMAHADALFELSPTALLFGAWNSSGEGGGLGAKFPRAFVSEIVAVNVVVDEQKDGSDPQPAGRRPGGRIDPMNTLRAVPVYLNKKDKSVPWSMDASKELRQVRPSEVMHGNIAPSLKKLGVTMDYAEHSLVISFAALRRLRFETPEKTRAARAALAALGLVAHLAQMRQGYALRSRCDLVPEGMAPLELVKFDGSTKTIELDYAGAVALYKEAVAAVRAAGFAFDATPLRLKPQPKLVYLVERSRELALAGKGGDQEDATDASA